MENSDFANIFWQMAEFLELKEDNPFKIRAYQNAVRIVDGLSEDLEDLIELMNERKKLLKEKEKKP